MLGFLLLLWIVANAMTHTCSAETVHCNVTHDGAKTVYRIPDFEAVGCQYSWSDSNGTVLANFYNKSVTLVASSSNRTLELFECSPKITYLRSCVSESSPRYATCNSSCSGSKDANMTRILWILLPILLILLVGVGVVLLVYYRRNRRCRTYNAVKTGSAPV